MKPWLVPTIQIKISYIIDARHPDIIVQNPIIKVDSSTEAFHNSSYALYFSLMNIITFFKSVCHVTGKMFIEKLLKKQHHLGGMK